MDLNENVPDEELVNQTQWRVEQLLLLHEKVKSRDFTQLYKQCYGIDYVCPLRQKHELSQCLRQHFKRVKFSPLDGILWISLEPQTKEHAGSSTKDSLTMKQSEDFPSLAESAILPQAPKRKKMAYGPTTKSSRVDIDVFRGGTASISQARQSGGALSAVPKTNVSLKEV